MIHKEAKRKHSSTFGYPSPAGYKHSQGTVHTQTLIRTACVQSATPISTCMLGKELISPAHTNCCDTAGTRFFTGEPQDKTPARSAELRHEGALPLATRWRQAGGPAVHARRARGGGACALGQLRAEAPSGAAGSLTGVLRASPAAAPPSSASSSASSSSSPPQLALLVMQPCGGEEEAAAGGGVLPGADAPPSASGGLMLFYELGPGDGEAEAGEEETAAAGGESTASPEELEEEEQAAASSGEAAAAGGGCKSCTYQGCSETTTQVAKQRKPWMCKRHRNKMYKDKYKRKKSDQALGGGGGAAAANAGGGPRAEDCVEGSVSATKQRTGSIGDRPARPTLLEQVLNKKRLSLLRSPEVVQFLQKQQQLLSQQALEQRQQQFQGAPG
ncbi:regulatory factor X-associated protein [Phasianus colchicus]|uniref:regulatory factor X-associated protein n=1 Tax=Phasianus colchicus TaxID=9054 RepID=UPI00129EA2A3|nr:regulatory factor X-associated protein [Phasianus colchicus]